MTLRLGCLVILAHHLGPEPVGEQERDQARQDDGKAVAVEEEVPRLAERHDAEHHDDLRDALQFRAADHLRIAPKDMPRSRWLRSRKVKIATGSRNRNVPAAITVQSGRPEPTWEGMKGGAVWARRLVMISAKAYSFQAVMKQNTAVAAMPVAASGNTILKKACMRV